MAKPTKAWAVVMLKQDRFGLIATRQLLKTFAVFRTKREAMTALQLSKPFPGGTKIVRVEVREVKRA